MKNPLPMLPSPAPTRRPFDALGQVVVLALSLLSLSARADERPVGDAAAVLQRHCLDCHNNDSAEGRINIEQLLADADVGRAFKDWERIVHMLRQRKMPPADQPQPATGEVDRVTAAIEQALAQYIKEHAGAPGQVIIRRLSSAELAYTVEDLTGLDLNLDKAFVSDVVGGEGFTNVGGAQFMEDATLERYLEAARLVADHAVIGAGPLQFFRDPGATGRELSAIHRILQIYRQHGFRTAAGEGAEPFGLDLYPRALLVAWRYRHRAEMGQPDATLAQLAEQEGLSQRLCEHLWQVVNAPELPFPASQIVARWHELPSPARISAESARTACDLLAKDLRDWQRTLAAASGDEEEASVLTAGDIEVGGGHSFTADINWPKDALTAEFELSVTTASREAATGALVIWSNPRLRFRMEDRRRTDYLPLASYLSPEALERLQFGRHPAGGPLAEHEFVLEGESSERITLQIPGGAIAAQLYVDVQLDLGRGADRIVRCRIADGEVEGETAAEVGETSTLLANPDSAVVARWREDVAQFARLLPEVSHREPAPSDRDPIPWPYDNTYNKPERNHFHTAIKYHRDDQFLVERILDAATCRQLDEAWTDLLTSFEYHDANLQFVVKKFELDASAHSVADLAEDSPVWQQASPEVRNYVQNLRSEFLAMQQRLREAEAGHVDDALQFAELAWRRPLTAEELSRLRDFYGRQRLAAEGDHTRAIRALMTRILVAPAFLYRAEPAQSASGEVVPLSDGELANRLSYFLWSSMPDEELRRAAAAGELRDPEQRARQARRMLADPKARRLATEFFGQWLGFYRFDEFRGIDAQRFPEFNESLRAAMYDEAVSFFEHVVRENRPVREILFADYTFLNPELAGHYGIDIRAEGDRDVRRVDNVTQHHRGGLLGLGAIHAVTSAPLRTSAVKRGDWVLRRVVGTPVPPPPADAGSIAADDVLADGLTVRRRLEAHRSDASCVNCHARIDPLGFALEHFDPIGRWRETYRDGQAIDAGGTLADGTEIQGMEGLRQYLRQEQRNFERTLCEKLLGFALGRGELASDRPLIEQMLQALEEENGLAGVVVCIVSSRQFCYRQL